MGLDQYAYAYPKANVGDTQTDLRVACDNKLHQWRKHPNLEGWMEALYRRKGGQQAIFNCAAVRLDGEDIDALEAAVKAQQLPETMGFFFGTSKPDNMADDLEFIAKARAASAQGLVVFYHSWW